MLQLGITIGSGQGSGLCKRQLIELGKSHWQMIQGAAKHTNIIAVAQVSGQGLDAHWKWPR